jgi:hypothetical protein
MAGQAGAYPAIAGWVAGIGNVNSIRLTENIVRAAVSSPSQTIAVPKSRIDFAHSLIQNVLILAWGSFAARNGIEAIPVEVEVNSSRKATTAGIGDKVCPQHTFLMFYGAHVIAKLRFNGV